MARRTLAAQVTCSPSHLLSPTEHVTRRRKPLPENHLLTAPESHAHLLTCSTGPKLPQQAVRAADALRGKPWPGTFSHSRATAATSPATAGTLGPASGRCRYLGIFPRCASHLGQCPRCARWPGHRGYLERLPDAPPDGWIAWRVHTHHQFPEGAPGQRIVARPGTVWHLPGAAAACQTANGPPAAGVRKCGAGRTRPSGPSHLALSRQSRNPRSRRRRFGAVHCRRGWAVGQGADRSSTTAPLGKLPPSAPLAASVGFTPLDMVRTAQTLWGLVVHAHRLTGTDPGSARQCPTVPPHPTPGSHRVSCSPGHRAAEDLSADPS